MAYVEESDIGTYGLRVWNEHGEASCEARLLYDGLEVGLKAVCVVAFAISVVVWGVNKCRIPFRSRLWQTLVQLSRPRSKWYQMGGSHQV